MQIIGSFAGHAMLELNVTGGSLDPMPDSDSFLHKSSITVIRSSRSEWNNSQPINIEKFTQWFEMRCEQSATEPSKTEVPNSAYRFPLSALSGLIEAPASTDSLKGLLIELLGEVSGELPALHELSFCLSDVASDLKRAWMGQLGRLVSRAEADAGGTCQMRKGGGSFSRYRWMKDGHTECRIEEAQSVLWLSLHDESTTLQSVNPATVRGEASVQQENSETNEFVPIV
nr:hypothetical protein CFP56_16227 [Quercus suber]